MLTFAALAQCFEELEHTSSRKQLTSLLAALLGQVDADEIAEVSYLLQGRVAPLYEPVEFGLGERSVEKAVAQAFGVPQADVHLKDAAAGDVGLVVAELAEAAGKSGTGTDRPVREVFAELRALANLSGPGSADGKVAGLTKLLAGLDPISGKHLVRIPLGTSRLGVGDVTVLAAFNEGRLGGTKQEKQALEDAYNRTSDLGLLGETLWRQGIEGVKTLQVMVGRPIRPQLAERLPDVPSLLDRLGGSAHAQLKFDGVRVQLHLDRRLPRAGRRRAQPGAGRNSDPGRRSAGVQPAVRGIPAVSGNDAPASQTRHRRIASRATDQGNGLRHHVSQRPGAAGSTARPAD
jgi:DNA ligase-1